MTDKKITHRRINLRLPVETFDWITSESEKMGVTKNALMIFALDKYMEQATVVPQIEDMLRALNDDK